MSHVSCIDVVFRSEKPHAAARVANIWCVTHMNESCVHVWVTYMGHVCMQERHIWMSHVRRESCDTLTSHMYAWSYLRHRDVANVRMRPVPHVNGSLRSHVPRMNLSFMIPPHEWVMSHIWVRHWSMGLSHMWICHEGVMSHIWMHHWSMRSMNESCPQMKVSCRTCEWVKSHTQMSHVAQMSHVPRMNVSCPKYECIISQIWMRHILNMNCSCPVYECVVSHIWLSHVPYMNASRPTYDCVLN